MKKLYIFIVMILALFGSGAMADDGSANIEMFVAGEKFKSMEAYNIFREDRPTNKLRRFSNEVRDEKRAAKREVVGKPLMRSLILEEVDVAFDPSKGQTWVVGEDGQGERVELGSDLSVASIDPLAEIIRQASVDGSVEAAVSQFKRIESDKFFHNFPALNYENMAETLQETVGEREGAVLLVADDKKIKLMQVNEIEGLAVRPEAMGRTK